MMRRRDDPAPPDQTSETNPRPLLRRRPDGAITREDRIARRDAEVAELASKLVVINLEELPEDLDFDKWQNLLQTACRERSKMTWLIGDLLNFGEAHYGNRYTQAMDITGLSYQTLANVKTVCRKFPFSRRRENLSLAHHAELAGLSVEVQDSLLDAAEKESLTRNQLRERVARRNRIKGVEVIHYDLPIPPPVKTVTYKPPSAAALKTLEEAQPKPGTETWAKAPTAPKKTAPAARDETKVSAAPPAPGHQPVASVERDLADLYEVWGRACEEAREQFFAAKESDFAELKKKKKKLH